MLKISKLLGKSIDLIKKDKVVLVPYIIYFLLLQIITTFIFNKHIDTVSLTIPFIITSWLPEMFIKGWTIYIATRLYRGKDIPLMDTFIQVVKRYPRLLLATIPLILPILLLFFQFPNNTEALQAWQSAQFLLIIPIVIIMIPVSFILEFIPLFIIAKNRKVITAIKAASFFVWHNLGPTIVFMSLSISISFLAVLASAICSQIPFIGESFLGIVFKAFGSSLVYVVATVFFFEQLNLEKENTIDIQV